MKVAQSAFPPSRWTPFSSPMSLLRDLHERLEFAPQTHECWGVLPSSFQIHYWIISHLRPFFSCFSFSSATLSISQRSGMNFLMKSLLNKIPCCILVVLLPWGQPYGSFSSKCKHGNLVCHVSKSWLLYTVSIGSTTHKRSHFHWCWTDFLLHIAPEGVHYILFPF